MKKNYHKLAIAVLEKIDTSEKFSDIFFEVAQSNPSAIVKAWEKLYPGKKEDPWPEMCKVLILSGNMHGAIEVYRQQKKATFVEAKKACENMRFELLRGVK